MGATSPARQIRQWLSRQGETLIFIATFERGVERMNLSDSSDGQGTDLHESQASEVLRLQNIHWRSLRNRMSGLLCNARQFTVQSRPPSRS
jgi:hypothetical protein